jgi:HlyD family secretion protein
MKRALIVLSIVVVVGVGVGAYYIRRGGGDIGMVTAPITNGDIIDAVAATGQLQAVISVTVGCQVSGNVAWLGADFNSVVKAGQVVAKLDPTLFQAAVDQAKANLIKGNADIVQAQANLEHAKVAVTDSQQKYTRMQALFDGKIENQADLDSAKIAVASANADLQSSQAALNSAHAVVAQDEATLSQAQVNLDHTIIVSPINGIVTQRSVDVGQTVQASMTAPTLFVIAEDLANLQISANIDESDVGRISPGQDVVFRVDAFPGAQFHGTLGQVRLNPTIVNNVIVYATIINVPNVDLRLKPGMTANLRVQVAKQTGLRLPNAALRFRPTVDVFTALKQPVPPEALGRGGAGRGGAGRGTAGAPNGDQRTAENAPTQRGGGRNAGDRQQRQIERFKAMSPDDQQQFIAQLVNRGQDASEFKKLMAGADAPPTPSFVYHPRYGDVQNSPTIERLFAPAPQANTTGRVWIFADHQLKPVTVRLGITDGTLTELLSSDLGEGAQVVTGIAAPGSARPAAGAAPASPFAPQRGGGGGPGRGF